ncbi:MAG: hypothetical protein NT018_10335 [Armatimonadetes bacterium]|nr:hypothetical protein [Armatimonadota bacterium]
MVAALVLITGVMLVMIAGAVFLIATGDALILPSLIPLAPWLVAFGSLLIILTEIILFFGKKEDRRTAVKDLSYLVPTMLISAGIGYLAQYFLWKI